MEYAERFSPYDILQIRIAGQWKDYATIRTQRDADIAETTVTQQSFDGDAGEFRIVNIRGMVVYSKQ